MNFGQMKYASNDKKSFWWLMKYIRQRVSKEELQKTQYPSFDQCAHFVIREMRCFLATVSHIRYSRITCSYFRHFGCENARFDCSILSRHCRPEMKSLDPFLLLDEGRGKYRCILPFSHSPILPFTCTATRICLTSSGSIVWIKLILRRPFVGLSLQWSRQLVSQITLTEVPISVWFLCA